MEKKRNFSLFCLIGVIFLLAGTAQAQEWWNAKQETGPMDIRSVQYSDQNPQQVDSASRIKWDDQYIEVMAGATANQKSTVNLAHAYSIASKTARHLAYEKLAETVAGLNITADATYDRELMRDANVKTNLRALVKNARVVNEQKKQMVDGSVWVEVTLGLKLSGQDGLINPLSAWVDSNPIVEQPPIFKPAPEELIAVAPQSGTYTGLIIDAGGLNAVPAMLPKIKTPDGRAVFGPNAVDREYMINQGLVGYSDSVASAKAMQRVGKNPLIVKAFGVEGANRTDIVLAAQEAMKVAAADTQAPFMRECRVVVVLN